MKSWSNVSVAVWNVTFSSSSVSCLRLTRIVLSSFLSAAVSAVPSPFLPLVEHSLYARRARAARAQREPGPNRSMSFFVSTCAMIVSAGNASM